MFFKLLALFVTGVAAQSATLTATSSQASYTVGSSVRVDLTVSNVADLYAFQLDVSFDPAILSVQFADEAGDFLANGVSFSPGLIDNTTGSVRFIADAMSGTSSSVTGSTTLATLTFAGIGPGTANVVPTNIILLDSQLSPIDVSATGMSIDVAGTNPVPEAGTYQLVGTGILVLCFRLLRQRWRTQSLRFAGDRRQREVTRHPHGLVYGSCGQLLRRRIIAPPRSDAASGNHKAGSGTAETPVLIDTSSTPRFKLKTLSTSANLNLTVCPARDWNSVERSAVTRL